MPQHRTALIVGASRGLGLGLARELLGRGWQVIATIRDPQRRTGLHDLADEAASGGRLEIETVEVTDDEQIAALRRRLSGRKLDLLFANAGVSNGPSETVTDVSAAEFSRVLLTNALAPMRILESFAGLVQPDGVVGVMSSGLGSVADNDRGGWEVYRASKAALNTLLRSFAVRHADAPWSAVTVAPGWVRTDMGGPSASLDVETSMRGVADVLEARRGTRGAAYLNYKGETVAW